MNFTRREKLSFLYFLLSQFAFSIFQEVKTFLGNKNEKDSFVLGSKLRQQFGPALLSGRPIFLARALPSQAATWAWASKTSLRARPPRLNTGPINAGRSSRFDGQVLTSGYQKNPVGHHSQTLASFSSSLSLSSPLFSVQPQRATERRWSMVPSPAPLPVCALPNG